MESLIPNIPTPNQIPEAPAIPLPERNSAPGTFDLIMSQNQDLMTRLQIALRQNLDLERQMGETIERNKYLELQARALHSEMNQVNEINKNMEVEFVRLREQRDSAEAMYAEFHSEAHLRIEYMANKIARLQNYKRRIKIWVKPMVEKLKATLTSERKSFLETVKHNAEMRESLANAKKQLSDAYTRIQDQHKEFDSQLKALVEEYESKSKVTLKDFDFCKAELETLRATHKDVSRKYQILIETHGEFENRAISAERRYQEHHAISEKTIVELQERAARLSAEKRSLIDDLDTVKVTAEIYKKENQELNQEREQLRSQYDGLQTIWEKSSSQLEEANEKISSLQKLNRDLSEVLSDKRREVEFLTDQIQKQAQSAEKQVEDVFTFLKSFAAEKAQLKNLDFIEQKELPTNERLKRLENMINSAEESLFKNNLTSG